MKWFLKQQRRILIRERELRRMYNVEVIRSSIVCCAIFFVLMLVLALTLVCYQPWQELRDQKQEYTRKYDKLVRLQSELASVKQQYIWLLNDHEYFEMRAMDQNNLSFPDERIVRIQSNASVTPRK